MAVGRSPPAQEIGASSGRSRRRRRRCWTFVHPGRARPALSPADLEILTACAAQIAQTVRQRRLTEQAAGAEQQAESERRRTALAAAAGRALSGRVASAKHALVTLRATPSGARDVELIDRVERAVDRIGVLAAQLEDLARARAGALDVRLRQVDVAEVVAAASMSWVPVIMRWMCVCPMSCPTSCPTRRSSRVGSPLFSYSGGSSETVLTAGKCLRVSRRYMVISAGTPRSRCANIGRCTRLACTPRSSSCSGVSQLRRRAGDQHIALVGTFHHPDRDVDVDAEPVRSDALRPPSMDADPHCWGNIRPPQRFSVVVEPSAPR